MELINNSQFNIGYICSKLQCLSGRADKTAFKFITNKFAEFEFSFNDLEINTNKFANLLKKIGIVKGDIIFTLLTKSPEQFFSFIGSLKLQAIIGTLFSNFGEDALYDRLSDSRAKVLITKKSLLKKILKIHHNLPELKFIIVTDIEEDISENILSYGKLMSQVSEKFEVEVTHPDTPSVIHYTSGSTGKPKGVLHAHRSILTQQMTSREILKLNQDEKYWCTADQGWVTGTSYGIIGPWSLGVTQIHFEGAFNAASYLKLLEKEKVTIWYTAPTLLRMLMLSDEDFYARYDLSSLKHIFSVGEPLNPKVIDWSRSVLNKEIYDTWFQTETGAIMIANRPEMPVKPGSMGKAALPEIKPAILSKGNNCLEPPNNVGNLCIEKGWSSMFLTYLNNAGTYDGKFINGYYYTGDEAKMDADGYFWFIGRSDDVINTAGHLISPFEIESAMLEVPEVLEAAAVAVPDEILFEAIVVFAKVKEDVGDVEELKLKTRWEEK